MSSKKIIGKPRALRVFEANEFERLLQGIKVASCMITESHQVVDEQSVLNRLRALTINGASDGNACSCCGVGPFETRAQQTAHYKQHWHTHNLKRKLYGKSPLSLGQFNLRQDDSGGSESDSETESSATDPASDLFAAATGHCKAFFTNKRNQVFCIYRCILHHKKEELSTDGDGTAWIDRCQRLTIPGYQRWAILMVSGGNFAGAIFSGGTVVLHKTLRSYVTRKGQGQAQVTRDNHGNAPRSAGATLRRNNQAQFLQNIQELMTAWAEDLKGCSLILYRAVGSLNKSALFGKNSPLKREDLRVRALPFPTRKPSYNEVKRVHETVASVEVYDTMEAFQNALIASRGKSTAQNNSDSSVDRTKKTPKIVNKQINRAKSRERPPRELPTALLSSEDEGPCVIDLETPADWTKTLSEQYTSGIISNSRKDLLNPSIAGSCSSGDEDIEPQKQNNAKKKKKKKSDENNQKKTNNKQTKGPPKIPASATKIWNTIADKDLTSLETILEEIESTELEEACNIQDPADGNTALHKAAIAAKSDMVTQLLGAGGDPCIRNHRLQTPYAAAHADTRLAFRFFQASHPHKYNYNKSQIPGPVTQEQFEQEKEKKLRQKRAKRQREKEKQAEKNKTNQFLQMTDREKVKADVPKCFVCATNLPKQPFEYSNYKFCSIRCLQNHRNLRPLHTSA